MDYEARHARGLNQVLIVACLLLSLIGFAAAGILPTGSPPEPLIGGLVIAACLGAAFIFWRRAADNEVQARVDSNGVYTRRRAAEPVPWDNIERAWPVRAGIQRIARFELRDPPRKQFGINTTFYDRGIDDLLAAVRHHRPDLGV